MNLSFIDWFIVAVFSLCLCCVSVYVNRYTKGVADFLVANRCLGKYLLCVSGGMSAVGAISFVAVFEMYYKVGFTADWWSMAAWPVGLFMGISGWVTYRFRETRAMTMAQFFEMRYSRRFRIYCGIIAWASGIINMGVFPAITARFFMSFCGLPKYFDIFGFSCSTFAMIMVAEIVPALVITFLGGMIAIAITDFLLGIFCYVVFLILLVFMFVQFDWSQIMSALKTAPIGESLINPYETTNTKSFNLFYFFFTAAASVYACRAWQGSQGFNAAAKSAHDAKMAGILGDWRGWTLSLLLMMLPICAFTFLHHSDFADKAMSVRQAINAIEDKSLQMQMTVPLALAKILPVGLFGLFCTVMIAATITNFDTYLHSWGSIFVQDVIIPIRAKPLSPRAHIWLLRSSIFLVAIFIFIFSLLFRVNDYILMYFQLTGAIYVAGAGCAIIGGLYWKRGCTIGAWAGMITGAVVSCGGLIIRAIWQDTLCPALMKMFPDWSFLANNAGEFPLDGVRISAIGMACAVSVYVGLSLWNWLVLRRQPFNMEQLLHRGKYAIAGDHAEDVVLPPTGLKTLLPTKEFSKTDKCIYYSVAIWIVASVLLLIVTTIYHFVWGTTDNWWTKYWIFKAGLVFVVSCITVVWFIVGGTKDAKHLINTLRSAKRNKLDDGRVEGYRSIADQTMGNVPSNSPEKVAQSNKAIV